MVGNPNVEPNILHKLLLTITQVSKIRKAFANGLSANTKFPKTQLRHCRQGKSFLDSIANWPNKLILAWRRKGESEVKEQAPILAKILWKSK